MKNDGRAVDIVAITGDIAKRGRADEYAAAEAWLRKTLLPAAGCGPESLVLVSGNHDLDRSALSDALPALHDRALRVGDEDTLKRLLTSQDDSPLVLKPHKAFIAFANRLYGSSSAIAVPWHRREFSVRGARVLVAALCSSAMAYKDDVQRKLLIGRYQATSVLPKPDESFDVVIGAFHHPLDWLAEFDESIVSGELNLACHLLIHGHLHVATGFVRLDPGGGVVDLAGGACYEKATYANAYQFLDLTVGTSPGSGEVRASLRVWDGHRWIPQRNAYGGKAKSGVVRFPFSKERA